MNDQPNGPNSSSDSIDPPRITYASPGGPRAPSHLELLLSDTGRSYDYQDVPTMSVLYQFGRKITDDHNLAAKTR